LDERGQRVRCRRNGHPTVKPLSVDLYIAALLCPPAIYQPRMLNLCAGTGTEAIAGVLAGFQEVTSVELKEAHCAQVEARGRYWMEWAGLSPEEQAREFPKVARLLRQLQELSG